ncbi:16S rRNA (guanine(966)-N(2))-methyltransferase RsmD [Aurantivibrio plasticivorans]
MKTGGQHRGKNQLRIIGGKWRGRKLDFLDSTGLRPTGDRIRETLFNWLRPDLHNANVADLFAGSGALGIEAVSQGAARAVLIEKDRACVDKLRQHQETLNAREAIEIYQTDALSWLATTHRPQFDIVFVDPPFADHLHDTVLSSLDASGCLNPGALVYVESPRNHIINTPKDWQNLRNKHSGDVRYALYQT